MTRIKIESSKGYYEIHEYGKTLSPIGRFTFGYFEGVIAVGSIGVGVLIFGYEFSEITKLVGGVFMLCSVVAIPVFIGLAIIVSPPAIISAAIWAPLGIFKGVSKVGVLIADALFRH